MKNEWIFRKIRSIKVYKNHIIDLRIEGGRGWNIEDYENRIKKLSKKLKK